MTSLQKHNMEMSLAQQHELLRKCMKVMQNFIVSKISILHCSFSKQYFAQLQHFCGLDESISTRGLTHVQYFWKVKTYLTVCQYTLIPKFQLHATYSEHSARLAAMKRLTHSTPFFFFSSLYLHFLVKSYLHDCVLTILV